MTDIQQQIEEIEAVLRKTPHHKATNGFIGEMRAKIARLKDKEVEIASKSSGGGVGYAVKKQGDATIVLIGPPSAGKSTLINKITNAESKVAAYAFTTLSVIPGMLKYKESYIQVLDVPGLIEGASLGKGRGKEVLSVARGADLLVIMTDPKRIGFLNSLVKELEIAGIRINKKRPDVRIEKMLSGGVTVRSNFKQEFDDQTVEDIAIQFGLKNAIITIKEKLRIDELIDSFSQRIVYKDAIFVVNKADTLKKKYDNDNHIYISAEKDLGIEELKEIIWTKLGLITIYLIEKSDKPNFDNPIIMKQSDNLRQVAIKIGSEFSNSTNLAKIWGNGAKFPGQEVPLTTIVKEGMMVRFL